MGISHYRELDKLKCRTDDDNIRVQHTRRKVKFIKVVTEIIIRWVVSVALLSHETTKGQTSTDLETGFNNCSFTEKLQKN